MALTFTKTNVSPGEPVTAQAWNDIVDGLFEVQSILKAAGGTVDWINLPDIGIKGNGHMMMQDKNNMQVAEVIQKWLVSKGLAD